MINNIYSIYILKQLFGYLDENLFLKIIKYNRGLQEKLDIGINNYIDYYNKIIIKVELDTISSDLSENIKFIML